MHKLIAASIFAASTMAASAQDLSGDIVSDIAGNISRVSGFAGEMSASMPGNGGEEAVREVLRFEPWQMLNELFREDIVLLMRHGPTDWSKRDAADVAPTDCENQRIMTEEGKRQMRDLGMLLVANELVPGRIVVSEWCRNRETLDAMVDGISMASPAAMRDVPVAVEPDVNLLLSLQGAPNVTGLRQLISDWNGGEQSGPLLVISHYTNIQELTEFAVYEGEMLVVDPKRNNRVLGYLRLKSAKPDVGHFDASVVDAAE